MTEEKQFKDTLNLPSTTLQMRANAPTREVEIEKFWQENEIYEKNLAQHDKNNSFILHDGPPYLSSDKIHIGHALNKILKDIIIKHKSMQGFYSPYVPGYDAHGLPIENAVVKNIKGGRSAVSPYDLRQKCREFALKNLKGQEENFKRLGVWGNWEHPYVTIAGDYEAQQLRIFWQMYKKGYIEKGLKPVYWCADCETALAEAEVEYQDISSYSIHVRFKFEENDAKSLKEKFNLPHDNIYAVIWTTTPWTIPSNMAICAHPRYKYTFFEHSGDIYVVADELLEKFIEDVKFENIKRLTSCAGADLENFKTKHPLYDRFSPIILGEHVTLDAGCGLVHTAPGHGLEDWEVGQKYGIETFSPLDGRGCWTDSVPDLKGIPYYKGNKIVIENLQNVGALLSNSEIMHSYPHCWRCKRPVIYRATPQWFVRVGQFKDDTLNAIKNVKWIPQSGEKRISNMVENRTDWCISRQRAWGVPIPVFYCKKCKKPIINEEIIENLAKIFEAETSDAWVKYEAKDLLPQGIMCDCGCTEFEKEKDIMDVWFDSGISWSAVVNARFDEFGKKTPVDLYLEGSDQHRGWFQSSILTSVATEGIAPYKSVLTHGFVLDEQGRKMSKSLGNTVLPQDIIKLYGADVLRLWCASVDYRNDIKIGENIIKQLVEIFKKTRNTARFLLSNLYDFAPENAVKYDDLQPIDKYALNELDALIKNIDDAFEKYEFYRYFQYLQNFAAVDLSAFYLDICKDRLYTAGKNSTARRASQTVLNEILQVLIRILTPVMPHQAEDIFQNMPQALRTSAKSVLLTSWAKTKPEWKNDEIKADFEQILKIREIVTRAIEPLRSAEPKIVGSSLEVCINLITKNDELLKKYEKYLKDIFIVSQVYINQTQAQEAISTYDEENIKIEIYKAQGEKCPRCWKYRKLNAKGICDECQEAIG